MCRTFTTNHAIEPAGHALESRIFPIRTGRKKASNFVGPRGVCIPCAGHLPQTMPLNQLTMHWSREFFLFAWVGRRRVISWDPVECASHVQDIYHKPCH